MAFEVMGIDFPSWRSFVRQGLGVKGEMTKITDPVKLRAWLMVRLHAATDEELKRALLDVKINRMGIAEPLDSDCRQVIKILAESADAADLTAKSGLSENAVKNALEHLKAL